MTETNAERMVTRWARAIYASTESVDKRYPRSASAPPSRIYAQTEGS